MSDKTQVARVAFRQEGENWVAYLAANETMEGALVMGSMPMALSNDMEIKKAFMEFGRICAARCFHIGGMAGATFTEATPAPEHERSGNA